MLWIASLTLGLKMYLALGVPMSAGAYQATPAASAPIPAAAKLRRAAALTRRGDLDPRRRDPVVPTQHGPDRLVADAEGGGQTRAASTGCCGRRGWPLPARVRACAEAASGTRRAATGRRGAARVGLPTPEPQAAGCTRASDPRRFRRYTFFRPGWRFPTDKRDEGRRRSGRGGGATAVLCSADVPR